MPLLRPRPARRNGSAMPPKGKAKAAAKGLAKMAPDSIGALPADIYDPNQKWNAEVQAAIEAIKQHALFGQEWGVPDDTNNFSSPERLRAEAKLPVASTSFATNTAVKALARILERTHFAYSNP